MTHATQSTTGRRQRRTTTQNQPAQPADIQPAQPADVSLLELAATAETVHTVALDLATARGIIKQGAAYIQTGERLISQVIHAGIYDAIYQDNLTILQELIAETHGKLDAARGIIRAIHIMTGAVRREAQTGVWYYAEERGIIALDKQGKLSYRDRYRDALERIRDNYLTRWFNRPLKSLNGLVRDEKPLLTQRGILSHVSKVKKAEFAAQDRAFIKAYLRSFDEFFVQWEREHGENSPTTLPNGNSRHNGRPNQTETR